MWNSRLLRFLFLVSVAIVGVVEAHNEPVVPTELIQLQAPWPNGLVRFPQTYSDHTECGPWCAVDFYTHEDRNDATGGWPVLAAHSGVASYEDGGCGGRRLVWVTNLALGIRTRYVHVRFPDGTNTGDSRPVRAGDIIAYARSADELDTCQNYPHLMWRVYANVGTPASPNWHHVDLRHVQLDGQTLFQELLPSSSGRYHGAAITSKADGDDELVTIRRTGDSGSQAGGASLIASVSLSQDRVVTAVRTEWGNLKLIRWIVRSDGTISRSGDSGGQAGAVSEIALDTVGERLLTAVRDSSGRLKLITWSGGSSGTINRIADSGATGPPASQIALFATGARAITAFRTSTGNLKLMTWTVNPDGSIVPVSDSGNSAGACTTIAMTGFGTDGGPDIGPATSFRIITAVRDGSGKLKLIVWDVNDTGAIVRRGDSGDQAGAVSEIATYYGPFGRVFTAVRTAEGTLKIISWAISKDGMSVSRVASSGNQAGAASKINVAGLSDRGLLTAVRTASGDLKLIAWGQDPNGTLYRLDDSGSRAGAVGGISLCGQPGNRHVTAVSSSSGDLTLIAWHTDLSVPSVVH